jgi:hypothetical protein
MISSGRCFLLAIILALSVFRPRQMTLIQHGFGFGGKVRVDYDTHANYGFVENEEVDEGRRPQPRDPKSFVRRAGR